jgi:hypothetical protein
MLEWELVDRALVGVSVLLRLIGVDGAAVVSSIAVGAYESGSMLGRYCC